jgi:dTDP-4-amino-4,6-dideoxygalactose transaminase
MRWVKLKPVFCDTEMGSYTISPRDVDQLITEKTSAVLAVNTFGTLANARTLSRLCEEHEIKLIFDSAHAFGCSDINGTMVGNFGDCEVFSFHATKIINSFEGGAITTNDDELAERCRLMRNFGFADEDFVVSLGINGKMSEVHAAMGITTLERFEELVNINKSRYFAYEKYFENTPQVRFMQHGKETRNNYQYVVIEVPPEKRDHVVKFLRTRDVFARRYFTPGCHKCPPYYSRRYDLPNTDKLCQSVIVLPTGPSVSLNKVEEITQLIKFALTNA